eukprot:12418285-Karenia_brevis.AAC.2
MKILTAKCDGNHGHASWDYVLEAGRFPAAAEAEDSDLFCVRMARCVRDHLLNKAKKKQVEKIALHVKNGRVKHRRFTEFLE